MEELLRIAYRDFMKNEEATSSERIRIINDAWGNSEKIFEILKKTASDKICSEICDLVYEGYSKVQEAAFICGFSYCTKLMTDGKTDFLPITEEGGALA